MNKHTSDNLYDNFFMPNLNQYSAKNCVKQERYLEVHSTFTTKLTLLHRTQVPTETSFKDTCKVPCIQFSACSAYCRHFLFLLSNHPRFDRDQFVSARVDLRVYHQTWQKLSCEITTGSDDLPNTILLLFGLQIKKMKIRFAVPSQYDWWWKSL